MLPIFSPSEARVKRERRRELRRLRMRPFYGYADNTTRAHRYQRRNVGGHLLCAEGGADALRAL
jgi:hypothetical protein